MPIPRCTNGRQAGGILAARINIDTITMPPLILTVRFYRSISGREPVREWLKRDLSLGARQAIGADIKTTQEGWPLGIPLVRKLDTQLWEVRSRIPEGIARVLFTLAGTDMVLLHGFIKKSDKTPRDELELAKQRRNEVHA